MHIQSHPMDFARPWTIAHQAPLSREFSMQEYKSGLQFPSLGDLHFPEVETEPPASPGLAGRFFYHCPTWEAPIQKVLPKKHDNREQWD